MLFFFFFNDTATTEIYTLSLHDALPIFARVVQPGHHRADRAGCHPRDLVVGVILELPQGHHLAVDRGDRKSTRLNSSHANISYAVFCLKKKKKNKNINSYSTILIITMYH